MALTPPRVEVALPFSMNIRNLLALANAKEYAICRLQSESMNVKTLD